MLKKIGLWSSAMLITRTLQKTSCGMLSWLSLLDYTSMGEVEGGRSVFSPSRKHSGTLQSMPDNISKSRTHLNYITMLIHKLCITSCGP